MAQFFEDILVKKDMDSFIQNVIDRYHYEDETEKREYLKVIAEEVLLRLEGANFVYQTMNEKEDTLWVLISLGEGIDELQEEYLKKQDIYGAYAVEAVASEMLLDSYQSFNKYISKTLDKNVERYIFLDGDSEDFNISRIPELLKQMSDCVSCNNAYAMKPKKSVLFAAVLTDDKNQLCQGVCMGCNRADCENRIDKRDLTLKWADIIGHPLSYGYSMIFRNKKLQD